MSAKHCLIKFPVDNTFDLEMHLDDRAKNGWEAISAFPIHQKGETTLIAVLLVKKDNA